MYIGVIALQRQAQLEVNPTGRFDFLCTSRLEQLDRFGILTVAEALRLNVDAVPRCQAERVPRVERRERYWAGCLPEVVGSGVGEQLRAVERRGRAAGRDGG